MSQSPSVDHPLRSAATVFDHIGAPLALIERTLRDQLVSDVELIGALGDHVLSSGGKRLRPALLLLTAELCGYAGPRRIQIASAIEMLHTATLLHDDVVDGSMLRRGRPSANSIWDNRRAVLAGDFLYARASSMLAEDGDVDLIEIFAATIRHMAEGELLQLERSFDIDVTEASYYDVIDRKSASLLAAACEAGAILGGVTRAERRRLATFGRELGLAFQLKDDALDYDTSADTLGKTRFADLYEGKVTLPLLLTLKRCTESERHQIARLLKAVASSPGDHADASIAAESFGAQTSGSSPTPDLTPIVDLVFSYRGVADTLRRAGDHIDKALEALAAFPEGVARDALYSAAEFTVARER
jgi:octaprenyl-diphosphate synthase